MLGLSIGICRVTENKSGIIYMGYKFNSLEIYELDLRSDDVDREVKRVPQISH